MHSHLKPIVSLLLRPSRQIDSKVICHSRIQISLASKSPDVLPLVTAERPAHVPICSRGAAEKRSPCCHLLGLAGLWNIRGLELRKIVVDGPPIGLRSCVGMSHRL